MSACQECGAPTQLNFPLCRSCWQQRKAELPPEGRRPALTDSSPLDVDCELCPGTQGTQCHIDSIPNWAGIRIVALGTWRVEVHECRYRKWKSENHVILQ